MPDDVMPQDANNKEPIPQGRGGIGQVQHLAKEAAILLSSGIVSYVGAFALQVLTARTLGDAAYGAWAVAFALANTLATFGLMGADWIILRQGSFYEGTGDVRRLRKTIRLALSLSSLGLGLLALAVFVASPLIATEVLHRDSLTPVIRVVAIMGPIMGLGQVLLFGTQAFKRMRESALIRNILQPAARLAFTAVALLVSATPLAALTGMLCAEIVLAAASFYALNRKISLRGPTQPIEQRELIKFALPIWSTKFLGQTRTQLFPLLLGSLAALTASGAFVASQRVAVAPSAIIATLNTVYTPMGSDLYLQGRRDELKILFQSIGKWSFALGFPLFCLQVSFPEEILSLFGESFRAARTALILLAVATLFNFGTGPVATTLVMIGRSRLALLDHVIVVAVEVALGVWLIPRHGLLGAAISRLIGTALTNCLRLIQVHYIVGFHPYRLDYWKPLAAGLVAAVTAKLAVTGLALGQGVAAAAAATAIIAVTYVPIVLALGLGPEDRAAIHILTKRLRRRRSPPPDSWSSVPPDLG